MRLHLFYRIFSILLNNIVFLTEEGSYGFHIVNLIRFKIVYTSE